MYFVHPQIEKNKILKSFFYLFKRPNLEKAISKLHSWFPGKKLLFLDMARTGFRIIIEKLNLKKSKLLIPAFICDVFYPILKEYEIEPVFVDVEKTTFAPKMEEIKNKLSEKIKAILIFHPFGLPLELEKISSEVLLIEDCAHSFGAKYKEKYYVGNFGIASFFSLYKQFPIARGGLLVCPENWDVKLKKTKFDLRDFLSFLNSFSLFSLFFKKFGQKISPKILRKEKGNDFLEMNDVSKSLFSFFFEEFEEKLRKRVELGVFFQKKLYELNFQIQEGEGNIFSYLSALVPKEFEKKRDKIVKELQKRGIFCTRIWHTPIILNEEAQKFWKINKNDFPNTLEIAKRIINFPLQSYWKKEDVEKIILILKKILYSIK